MLKKLLNECRLKIQITTKGPLLVKSGQASAHGADMSPVITFRNNQEQVFIPGSSLKGVFRSHLEKVIRTLNESAVCALENPGKIVVDNGEIRFPGYTHVSCGKKFELRKTNNPATVESNNNHRWRLSNPDISTQADVNPLIYKDSCPACRLFGSTYFAGRILTNDAYLNGNANSSSYLETRDGVGIDRFSGGSAFRAKFELKVVKAGVTFDTDVYMKNFEIWQLGALMVILSDLEDEIIRVGSGKSRGLGKIQGKTDNITIQYVNRFPDEKQPNEIWGLGKFLSEDTSYGTDPDDMMSLDLFPEEETQGIRRIQVFEGDHLNELKTRAVQHFVEKIQTWEIPATMQFDHSQWEEVNQQ